MTDLNKLSPQALSAAMRGGTDAWGKMGSATRNVRYSEPIPPKPGKKKKCWCGCGGSKTHKAMANGVCLTEACELGIARWVRTGQVKP